jgi:hypothetical protein
MDRKKIDWKDWQWEDIDVEEDRVEFQVGMKISTIMNGSSGKRILKIKRIEKVNNIKVIHLYTLDDVHSKWYPEYRLRECIDKGFYEII